MFPFTGLSKRNYWKNCDGFSCQLLSANHVQISSMSYVYERIYISISPSKSL